MVDERNVHIAENNTHALESLKTMLVKLQPLWNTIRYHCAENAKVASKIIAKYVNQLLRIVPQVRR